MIRLLSLFSGIGAFEKALDRIGAKYELVNYCEIDKYASMAYAAVHGVSEELNLRDVQTIDCDKLKGRGVNLVTWGFPCQDISVAGRMRGFEHEGQKTRSGLFYDALKVIRELQPEIAIAENVKALTGKRFEAEFAAVRGGLSEAGYNNYYAVLDASDYGIPQHRERVFIVSIRKDIDRDKFAFPQKEPLRLRVKDLLEYEVDEKYYIDTERTRELIRKLAEEGKLPEQNKAGRLGTHETDRGWNENGITSSLKGTDHKNPVKIALKQIGETGPHQTDRVYDPDGLSRSLKSTDYTHPVNIAEVKQIGNLLPDAKFENTQRGRVYDPNGCSPTISTMQGGNLEPKILQVGQLYPDNAGNLQNGRIYDPEGCSPALHTMQGGGQKEPKILTDEPVIAAMRGRNPDNPGDRHSGIPTEQRLEINTSGTSNTITTVQKDNYVIKPKNTGCKAVGDLKVGGERGIVYDAERSMCTLSATQYKDPHNVLNNYRIRKLTPKECWRLMGFDDDDFEKAKAAGISNTQLYKQAGNSIVVQVLERIFEKLIETQGIGDGNE